MANVVRAAFEREAHLGEVEQQEAPKAQHKLSLAVVI